MGVLRSGRARLSLTWAGTWALGLSLWGGAAWAADPEMGDCAGVGRPRVLHEKQAAMESMAFLPSGKLLYSHNFRGTLMRKDSPASAPVEVARGLSSTGGIVVRSEHEALVGTGNGLGGFVPFLGLAGVARVDLTSGTVTPVVKGLSMANGLAQGADGSLYASDDLSKSLDRVLPDGTVQRKWLALNSNGLVLSKDGRTLFVNQFLPAAILAVSLPDGKVRMHALVPSQHSLAGLDGLDIDEQGHLYVVAYFSGEVWRVSPQGQFCRLVQGLTLPSAVAVGKPGQGFQPDSIYVVTHAGSMLEVPHAVPRP